MIAKKLKFEPYSSKRWAADGIHGKHWVDDNGLWDKDPQNSGPDLIQAASAQKNEDTNVFNLLNDEAKELVRHLIET